MHSHAHSHVRTRQRTRADSSQSICRIPLENLHSISHGVHGANRGNNEAHDCNHYYTHEPGEEEKSIEVGRHFI